RYGRGKPTSADDIGTSGSTGGNVVERVKRSVKGVAEEVGERGERVKRSFADWREDL
ncbi:hypothetical protein HK097_008107, partial [Rhizophlyctis rosea]